MIVNIYLHQDIAHTLMCFGNDMSEVVNKILEAGEDGLIELTDHDPCPDKTNCLHYRVNIFNENYLLLYEQFGHSSNKISLRRLLYWFVENEIYDELGWKPIKQYINSKQELFVKKVKSAIHELSLAKKYTSSSYNKEFLTNLLIKLQQELL